MKVRVLGCSGGIGGRHLRTTALLVDHDILVDAGTGVGELSIAELSRIDHVFLTHAHLDHVACLPFLVDTVGDRRERPVTVYALAETLAALRRHIFNGTIWPDFTALPTAARPYLRCQPLRPGERLDLSARRIEALPVSHTVPAVGYRLDAGRGSLVYSGDTTSSAALWAAVNAGRQLRYLLIETAFSDGEERLARESGHLCPRLLAEELGQLVEAPEVFITHLKPGQIELTLEQIAASRGEPVPRMLQNNQVFEL
jgi:ribonuclease BN (tRNA processing enzyme)